MDLPTHPLLFSTPDEWRAWLAEHHAAHSEVWLVHYKRGAGKIALTYEGAVEEALCFGWIDGLLKSIDAESYALRYSPRRPNSVWSASNIARVEKLVRAGRMTPAGLQKVQEAQASGQWDAALQREEVDAIPPDLYQALRRRKGAVAAYRALSPSRRKQLLYWLTSAKRAETRARRIQAIVDEVSAL